MFRTWNGNTILLKKLIKLNKPISKKEIKKNIIFAKNVLIVT